MANAGSIVAIHRCYATDGRLLQLIEAVIDVCDRGGCAAGALGKLVAVAIIGVSDGRASTDFPNQMVGKIVGIGLAGAPGDGGSVAEVIVDSSDDFAGVCCGGTPRLFGQKTMMLGLKSIPTTLLCCIRYLARKYNSFHLLRYNRLLIFF